MKSFFPSLGGILFGLSSLSAQVPPPDISWLVERRIKGQIGESGAWDDSLSGGYLFRFSADVWGDSAPEYFLANSSGFSRKAAWLVFSNGQRFGWLSLSAYEFLVIREGDVSIFPSGGTSGGTTAMSVQTWDETGIKNEFREVHQEELGVYLQDWKARGQVIRPQLEMLRLVDYLQGSREWEPVDLREEEVEFRGNTGAMVLKRDIERLKSLNLRPEQALEMFESMQEAEGAPVSGKLEPSGLNAPENTDRQTSPAHDALVGTPAAGPESWPWLAVMIAVITLAAAILFLYRSRAPRG